LRSNIKYRFRPSGAKGGNAMPVQNHRDNSVTAKFEDRPRYDPSAVVATVAEKAKDAATQVGERADRATEAVGAGMESAADAIRKTEPAAGMLHNAGEAIANKLQSGGQYLEQRGLTGIGEDVTNLIRHSPVPSLLIGVGIGVLLARLVRR
jgi:hypothetical protein